MKLTLTTIFLIFISLNIFGQTIFDIQVDAIYLDDGDIVFLNKGDLNIFKCQITPIKQRDFDYNLVLECEEGSWPSEDTSLVGFDEILKFTKPEEINAWLEGKIFGKEANLINEKHHSYLQYFNDDLIAQTSFRNYNVDKPRWYFLKVDFWDYVYLRINSEYLIIALVYETDADVGGYIIPTKKGGIVATGHFQYFEHQNEIDITNLSKHISPELFFRIKENNGEYELWDKLFLEKILDRKFKNIRLDRNYIFCENINGITIFDKSFKTIFVKDVKAAYDSLGSVQFLKGDKIQWLDYEGIVHDTFPTPKWGLCGTISSTDRKIGSTEDVFFESYETGYWGRKQKRDSIVLGRTDSINSIKYLNNKLAHKFDEYSDLYAVFSFPYNTYLIENHNNTRLITIKNTRDSLEKELIILRGYSGNGNRDSLNNIINGLKDEIKIRIEFEGNLESYGYNHPIKFKTDNLYGYFPQNIKAKYKRIDKFKFFFAEFELEDGRKGWLDIYGNEYLDE